MPGRVKLFYFGFFSVGLFFHDHSRITGLRGRGEGISLTPHYHFHPLHRPLDNSRTITAESSPLHISSSRIRAGNLWFTRPLSFSLFLKKFATGKIPVSASPKCMSVPFLPPPTATILQVNLPPRLLL